MKESVYFDVALLAPDGKGFRCDYDNKDFDRLLKSFTDFIKFGNPGYEFSVTLKLRIE